MSDNLVKLLFLFFAIFTILLKHHLISLKPEIPVIQNHCYLAVAFDNSVSAEIINNTMKLCYNKGNFNYDTFNDQCTYLSSDTSVNVQSTESPNMIYIQSFPSASFSNAKSWTFDLKKSEKIDFGLYDNICQYRMITFIGYNHKEPLVIPFTIYNSE